MKKITREWFNSAKADLMIIDKIIDDAFLTHQVAFHSQQAIEKSFKAVLEEYELPFRKTHSLETLAGAVRKTLKISIDLKTIKMLDQLYLDARYPGELGLLPEGKPSLVEAKKFSDYSREVYTLIQKHLNP